MSLGACLRWWIVVLAGVFVLALTMVSPPKLAALIDAEIGKASDTLGQQDTQRVLDSTTKLWRSVFAENIDAHLNKLEDGNQRTANVAAGLNRGIRGILERIKALSFLAMFRIHWLMEAIVPALIFIVAAAVDGLASRRKRAFSFRPTSTVRYNTSSYFVISASMMPLVYLILPMAVPPVLLLLSGLAVAGAVWVFFCHLPGAAPIIGMRT